LPTDPSMASKSITTVSVTHSRKNGKKKVNQYLVNTLIGQGKFSKVYKCLNEQNGLEYAMKVIDKKKMKGTVGYNMGKEKRAYNFLDTEIAILKKMVRLCFN
jgi:serine/threonine protein kinase